MDRPLRLYLHTFIRGADRLEIVRSGATPCQAKGKAFVALEQELVAKNLPRSGWRLYQQVDVTHLGSV